MEGFTMNAEKGHSQSADNSQLLAHKSSPQGGHAFKLKAPYKPTGDQPQAIEKLVNHYSAYYFSGNIYGYFLIHRM